MGEAVRVSTWSDVTETYTPVFQLEIKTESLLRFVNKQIAAFNKSHEILVQTTEIGQPFSD